MGLRQLYFLLGGLLRKLVYLSLGLSVILAFIGVKLVFHAMHEYHLDERLGIPFSLEIPIWLSLTVIIGTLTITTIASLIKAKQLEDKAPAPASTASSTEAQRAPQDNAPIASTPTTTEPQREPQDRPVGP
jgi:tellurite resistance protein TerC